MGYWQPENRMLETGQDTDYTPAGRAAQAVAGVQRAFETLDANQFSGTTSITVNSIATSHTNICVLDKRTGLFWNRDATPASFGTGAQDLLWDATGEAAGADEEDIFYWRDQANAQGLSGFTDWRIPNLYELISLQDHEPPFALPDTSHFPNLVSTDNVWTYTTRANSATRAHYILMGTGGSSSNVKTTTRVKTMLVRG